MAPTKAKSQADATPDEIMKRWQGLNLDQRRNIMCFNDCNLVHSVVLALGFIQKQHEACIAAGFRMCSDDPFKKSLLLGQVLSVSAEGSRLDDNGTKMVDISTYVLHVTDQFLMRDDIWVELRSVLPDFLDAPRSRRRPLPIQRWKQIWEVFPSSFELLEQRVAQTLEQAFFRFGAHPEMWTKDCSVSPAEDQNVVQDVALEAWMVDDVSQKASRTTGAKKQKTKVRRRVAAPKRASRFDSLSSDTSLQTCSTCTSENEADEDLASVDEVNEKTWGRVAGAQGASCCGFLGTDVSSQASSTHSETEAQDDFALVKERASADALTTLLEQESVSGEALASPLLVACKEPVTVMPAAALDEEFEENAAETLSEQCQHSTIVESPPGLGPPGMFMPQEEGSPLQYAPSCMMKPVQVKSVAVDELAYMLPVYPECDPIWLQSSMQLPEISTWPPHGLSYEQSTLLGSQYIAAAPLLGIDEWLAANRFVQYSEHLLELAGDVADLAFMTEEDCVQFIFVSEMPKLAARRFRMAVRALGAQVSA